MKKDKPQAIFHIDNLRECPYCHWWQIKPKKLGDTCENPDCEAFVKNLWGDWLIWDMDTEE